MIRRILLDRPPLNVLDIPASRRLEAQLKAAGRDRPVRVVVLSGKGKCFSAGVDIRDHTKARVKAMLMAFHGAVRALEALEKPVIAHVHGHCLGGGMELAMACDFIVADRKAVFGLPEISLGCYPPVAAVRLAGIVGRQRANEAILLGGTFSATEAKAMGLVHSYRLEPVLERLLSLSGSALACAKAAMRAKSLAESERIYLARLMKTRDMEEGVRAFLEKRKPVWEHGQETRRLLSIPGMRESVQEGLRTPVKRCRTKLHW